MYYSCFFFHLGRNFCSLFSLEHAQLKKSLVSVKKRCATSGEKKLNTTPLFLFGEEYFIFGNQIIQINKHWNQKWQRRTLMSTWKNLKKSNDKTIIPWKIQNRQASYFNHSSKVYMAVQCMFYYIFQHNTNTTTRSGTFSFSPTISVSQSTSLLHFPSHIGYTN